MIAIVLLLITFLPLRPVEGSISSRLSSIDWVAFLLVVSAVALLLLAVSWCVLRNRPVVRPLDDAQGRPRAHLAIGGGCSATCHRCRPARPARRLGMSLQPAGTASPASPLQAELSRFFMEYMLTDSQNRNVIGSIFTGIGSGLQYCVLFFLPQYSRIVQGRTTITSALLIMPFALSCSVTVVIGGQVVAR